MNLFLRKIGVDKREGVEEKTTKNNIEKRACSQESDVPHSNSSMYFFCYSVFSLGFSSWSDIITAKCNNTKKHTHIQEPISVSKITI